MTIAAGLFAGCGNAGSSNGTVAESTGTQEASETDAASGGEENKLTVWCWDPMFNINAMQKAEEIYKEKNADFQLEIIETPWADLQTKVTTAATSGNLSSLPDIILMQDGAFQKNVISYPDAFVDLTETGIDFSQFSQGKMGFSMVDGKNYGVPFDNGAAIACYRTDILEQAGLTVDDFSNITWEEYIEKGKIVLEKTGKPLLSCLAGESDIVIMMLQSAGGSFFDEEGNPYFVNNDILKEVMDIYAKMVKEGVLVEVNDWDQYIGTLNSETVAGTINGCWIMASIQSAQEQSGKWAITNMPKLVKAPTATNYTNQGGSSWAIMSSCKNVELATDFLGSTFGGSVDLYEKILSTGAIATYIPAAKSEMYGETSEFFSGDAVYTKIVEYGSKIPQCGTGVYFYEARDAVATAITNVVGGSDVKQELKIAEETVSFSMGK